MNTSSKQQTTSEAVLADPRWKSLVDVSADGSFYYSVKSTGILPTFLRLKNTFATKRWVSFDR